MVLPLTFHDLFEQSPDLLERLLGVNPFIMEREGATTGNAPASELHVQTPVRASSASEPFYQGFHPGISCDRSGMNLIVGMRFHLRGSEPSYDLCQAEYDKLDDAEKGQYDAITPPQKGQYAHAVRLRAHRVSRSASCRAACCPFGDAPCVCFSGRDDRSRGRPVSAAGKPREKPRGTAMSLHACLPSTRHPLPSKIVEKSSAIEHRVLR